MKFTDAQIHRLPDEEFARLQSAVFRELSRRRRTRGGGGGPGPPRKNVPRCPCDAMTLTRALARGHVKAGKRGYECRPGVGL